MAGRVTAAPGNRGSGGGWHRDSFARQFKAIIYLDDVDESRGPFEYLTETTSLGSMVRDIWRGGLAYGQTRLPETQVEPLIAGRPGALRTVTGRAGTLVLADTRGIHRGMPIATGARHALTNYYFAPDVVTPSLLAHFTKHVSWVDGGSLDLETALAFEPDAAEPTPA